MNRTVARWGTNTVLAAMLLTGCTPRQNRLSSLEQQRETNLLQTMQANGTKDLDTRGFSIGGEYGHFKSDEFLLIRSDKPFPGGEQAAVENGLKYEMWISREAYDRARQEFDQSKQAPRAEPE